MNRTKTPLFLIEAVIMLLVFALSSAICLQVFVGAKNISDESYALDSAVIEAQNAAEIWQANKGDFTKTADDLNAVIDGKNIIIYYDKNFVPAIKEASVYQLKLSPSGAKAGISVYKAGEDIYSIFCEAVIFGG